MEAATPIMKQKIEVENSLTTNLSLNGINFSVQIGKTKTKKT